MTSEISKGNLIESSNETFFEKFLTTNGRIGRMTYLKRNLMLMLMVLLATFVIEMSFFAHTLFGATLPAWTNAIYPCMMLALCIPDYCLNTKRLHDLGKDSTVAKIFLGLGILANVYYIAFPATIDTISPFMMIYSVLSLGFLAYLLFMRGDENTNEYGETK